MWQAREVRAGFSAPVPRRAAPPRTRSGRPFRRLRGRSEQRQISFCSGGRYEKGRMIITTNQSVTQWGQVFGDDVIAAAVLDRLLHHSHTLVIQGESYRPKQNARPASSGERRRLRNHVERGRTRGSVLVAQGGQELLALDTFCRLRGGGEERQIPFRRLRGGDEKRQMTFRPSYAERAKQGR